MKLTPAQTKMLDRIKLAKSPMLLFTLTGSGGQSAQTLHSLIKHGLVNEIDHRTVKDRSTGGPAPAYVAVEEEKSGRLGQRASNCNPPSQLRLSCRGREMARRDAALANAPEVPWCSRCRNLWADSRRVLKRCRDDTRRASDLNASGRSQGGLDVRPFWFRSFCLKQARRSERGLELDLPFPPDLIARQELGLEINGGRFRLAPVREHLQAAEIDLDAFGDEGNEVLHVVAGEHGDPRRLEVNVDEIAGGDPSLQHLGATDEHSQAGRQPGQRR